MGTVLDFRPRPAAARGERNDTGNAAEIVIFPGVRIERYDLDLGYRLVNSAGNQMFDGLGSATWPRQSS